MLEAVRGADGSQPPLASPEEAWQAAEAQAKANSPQPRVTVKPGDTMTGIAVSHGDTLRDVEGANPQIHCANEIDIGETVYLPKKTPAQVVTGVDNSQIEPIITAAANAKPAQLTQIWDKATTESWGKVKQATFNMLIGNNTLAYPDVTAAAQVKQLNALEPHNATFAAVNNAALAEAKQQWTQMGVTKSQLSPIIKAYGTARQTTQAVNQYLRNPHAPHKTIIDHALEEAEQQANASLDKAITHSLTDAASVASAAARKAGSNPVAVAAAAGAAISNRAANIESFVRNDPALKKTVENVTHDFQVTQPAQKVAKAYKTGGAEAAANELKAVTTSAGSPTVALQIIQASHGTIQNIANDMNSLPTYDGSNTEFGQIYAGLSQSVNAATPINTKFEQDGQTSISVGSAAADLVGKTIATNVPNNLDVIQLQQYYQNAAQGAVGNDNGTALTLATAAALKQQGNDVVASYLVEGAADGLNGLRAKTDSDMQAFVGTTAIAAKLQSTWTPFLTQSQMTTATNQYLAGNPDVRQKADDELTTISQDGDSVVEAEAAWHTYGTHLTGISDQLTINAPKDLSAAAQSLTGSGDDAVVFAVAQSTRLNASIGATLAPLIAAKQGGNSWTSWPGWSSIRNARSVASAGQKSMQKGGIVPNWLSDEAHNVAAVGLPLAGLGLTGLNVYSKGGFPVSTPTQAVYSIYSGLGLLKYSGETYNALAKADWAGKLTYTNANDTTAGKVLTSIFGKDSTTLTKSPAFQALGFFYYGLGAFSAGADAVDDSNSDWVPAAWDSAEALGNAGNAAKPVLETVFNVSEEVAGDIGLYSSLISLAATAGSFGWQMVSDWRANDAYRADSANFLQSGLGINPGLAKVLASAPSPTAPALQQYAAAYHMTPGQLLSELNKQWNEHRSGNVELFLDQAARMQPQSNGTYARTQPLLDGQRNGSEVMEIAGRDGKAVSVPQPITAESLGQLNYWADVLFGNNEVG